MTAQLKNIFSKNLVTVKESDNLQHADELMNNHRIRHLPVVNTDHELVGILSKSDFFAIRYVDARLNQYSVKSVMSSPFKVFAPSAKIQAVAQLFIDQKISSAIIVDSGEVVGIVTSEDLLNILAEKDEINAELAQMDIRELSNEGWISMTTMRKDA